MEKIPVTNNTASPIYVGADMIPPGETRHFFEDQVPAHLRPAKPAPEPEAPKDELLELSSKRAADIIEAIPGLSDEDLTRLDQLEADKGEKARKSVAAAISEETLKRAEAKTQAGGGGAE